MICKRFLLTILFFSFLSCASSPGGDHIVTKIKEKKPVEKMVLNEKLDPGCLQQAKLYKFLAKEAQSKQDWFQYHSKVICQKYHSQLKSLEQNHANKVGVIIQEGKEFLLKNKLILKGILKYRSQTQSDQRYIIKKVSADPSSVKKAFAELVVKQKVGLIITWGSQKVVNYISKWQELTNIPTLVLEGQAQTSETRLKLFPNRKNYIAQMLKKIKQKKIKRLAILKPLHYKKAPFLLDIEKHLKQNGIEIVFNEVYDSNTFESLDRTCRKIFNINRYKRREEYMKIRKEEMSKAKEAGFALNEKLVFLPAEISYDAIFIPDNVKIVHHFIKLFDYYKMPKIPLIGTYEWRSKDLLKTNSEYLSNAIFFDFVGDYSKTPVISSLEKQKTQTLEEGLGIENDYRLMGYYAALLSSNAIKKSQQNKKKLVEIMSQMKINDRFLNSNKAFKQNEFNWPSFAFGIKNERVVFLE